jgi:polyisoprenoid-binding protein YceI|tara:strand:+ start:843 stop:1250 length:408 start_codon:yes stop_codon:yes gene_type:complete
MIRTVKRLIILAILSITCSTGFAANYQLEPIHTQILFFCDHLGFSKSQGEFLSFEGSFSFDPNDVTAAHVEISIDTASIDMDNQKWNDHMKNQDFFDVDKFPKMTFISHKIESLADKTMNVYGSLTLLDHSETIV